MKKVLTFVLAAALLASLWVCVPAALAANSEPIRITLVLPMSANEVWKACADGFEAACAALGVEGNVVAPATNNDVNLMNALVETAIAEGVDGVITQGINPEAQAPVCKKLDEACITYCFINSDASDTNRLAFIGTGDQLGIVGGKTVVDKIGSQKIVFATGIWDLTAPIGISLHNAYLSELEKAPGGFEEVVVIHTAADQLVATQEWTNAFNTYPEINAGMNIDGFGGLGAARAMKELGKQPGDVMIIGIDDVPETLDAIRDGWLYGTMTQNFFRMGYEPVGWIKDYIANGAKPAQEVNDSGTMLVTKDNIETYAVDMRDPTKW